jgi:hypothetical protein
VRFDRGVVHIVVAGDIVDNYYIRFDRGVVHIVVSVLLFPITVWGLTEDEFVLSTRTVSCFTEEWFILLWRLYC